MPKGKKYGGRTKGTPNKPNPMREALRSLNVRYYTEPVEGGKTQFELDCGDMTPDQRAAAHAKLLKFHTPETKATDITLSMGADVATLEDRLRTLAGLD